MPFLNSKSQQSQTNEEPALEPINFDALLLELGQFGRYQRLVYLSLIVAVIFTSIYNYQFIFTAEKVAYSVLCPLSWEKLKGLPVLLFFVSQFQFIQLFRCRVPECEASPERFATNGWGKFALPVAGYDCWRRVPIGEKCEPASFSNESTPCYSWVYESHYTIVPEFDLACQEWKRTLVGTIHNAGVFMAIPTTATISDAFGRRFALIGTCVAPAVVGVARAYSHNYILYLVLEFTQALVGNGAYSTAFIIALEIVGLKKRVIGGNIISCTYAMGLVVTAGCAWAMPYWRTYTIAIFAPSFLFIFYSCFFEESVRWLIAKGKRDEAVKLIFKIARINRVTLSPNTMKLLTEGQTKRKVLAMNLWSRPLPEAERKEPSLIRQVLGSKIIMSRMLVVSFWWISTTMIYYGLTINAVSLKGNKYVNFILTALVDIPGALLSYITLDRFGRKSTIMTCFFACGLSLIILPAIDNPKFVITLTLLGKMMISLIYSGIYIYTIELFPTKARHMLMGCCSMLGRIGSMAAPQTPLLMVYGKSLPYLLFGCLAGCAGMLMLFTPETLHMKLPDTIAQAEEMSLRASRNPKRKVTDMIT